MHLPLEFLQTSQSALAMPRACALGHGCMEVRQATELLVFRLVVVVISCVVRVPCCSRVLP